MNKHIDCFFIGHNEMQFSEHEKTLRLQGISSGVYRNFDLEFIQYDNNPYTVPEIYNLFHVQNPKSNDNSGPMNFGDIFSGSIAYLGTYLHRYGFSFDYVNSFRDEKEYLIDRLQTGNICLIAITTTLYVTVQPILEVMSLIRKYNNSAKIVLGGPFIAAQTRVLDETSIQYLFKLIGADYYVNSQQGEATLAKLLHALKKELPLENIPNLFFKYGNKYVGNPIEVEDNQLEENAVDWNLFSDRLGKIAYIRTSISCPFSCSYCELPQQAGKYQTISVSALERELNSIARTGKVSGIMFSDDTFNVPPQRFKEILHMIIKNKYELKWSSFFRCQFADQETVELMKESGCEGLYLGIESANQKVLDNMNKAVKVDQYKRGITFLKKADFNIMTSILIGFPGETEESVQETISFIKEYDPTFMGIHLWYYSLLTPIWEQREKYQCKGSMFEWSHATMDSHTACDLIANIPTSLKTIFVPQYNFDFCGVINLLHRGMSLEQVKYFLKWFNEGVKEKLANPGNRNISIETVENLKKACQWD